ncbi:hypothetical protein ACTQ4E_13690 [Lawsonibacter sp. LCP25S3_G6]|uniref:hypothetical protein n=1 Tax=unclassified Lawsonibacter TaxID=2617946 RepID=UPI003F9B33B5
MERIVSKIAGMGVPGLVLLVAINATGLSGAAAMTTALAAIGPGGMLGGVACLLAAALILDGLTEWGFDALFAGVVRELYVNGETKDSIKHKISKYPITKKLKRRLLWEVENFRAA